MPRKAKTNNEETTCQGHEFDHTTPSAPQNETLRTTTNRTGTGQDEPNQPEHSVTGKNETNRTGKTKRTVPEQSEPQGHESSYTRPPQSSRPSKQSKPNRSGAGQDETEYAKPKRDKPKRKGTSFEDLPQSARELLIRQSEAAEAPEGSRKRPLAPRNPDDKLTVAANEGPTADILAASIELFNLPRIDIHDEAAVRQRVNEFFEVYARRGLKPTVAGLGMALRLDRRRLWEIHSGAKSTNDSVRLMPPEVKGLIKDAYTIMESLWEAYTISGKLNPVTSIFLGKNHYGYVDRMDHVVAPGAEEQVRSAEEIRRNYLPSGTEVETEFE